MTLYTFGVMQSSGSQTPVGYYPTYDAFASDNVILGNGTLGTAFLAIKTATYHWAMSITNTSVAAGTQSLYLYHVSGGVRSTVSTMRLRVGSQSASGSVNVAVGDFLFAAFSSVGASTFTALTVALAINSGSLNVDNLTVANAPAVPSTVVSSYLYTTAGSTDVTVPAGANTLQYLLIGPGGQGGVGGGYGSNLYYCAGAGGQGGVSAGVINLPASPAVTVNVGAAATATAPGSVSYLNVTGTSYNTTVVAGIGGVGGNGVVLPTDGGVPTGAGGGGMGGEAAVANLTGFTGIQTLYNGGNGGNGSTTASGGGGSASMYGLPGQNGGNAGRFVSNGTPFYGGSGGGVLSAGNSSTGTGGNGLLMDGESQAVSSVADEGAGGGEGILVSGSYTTLTSGGNGYLGGGAGGALVLSNGGNSNIGGGSGGGGGISFSAGNSNYGGGAGGCPDAGGNGGAGLLPALIPAVITSNYTIASGPATESFNDNGTGSSGITINSEPAQIPYQSGTGYGSGGDGFGIYPFSGGVGGAAILIFTS